MQTDQPPYRLLPHPARPPLAVSAIEAQVMNGQGPWFQLRWRIENPQCIVVPPFAGKGRADDLWRTTCFELFLRPDGGFAYSEFNFSPSERWAAYDFEAGREGMRQRPMPRDPVCTLRRGGRTAIFDVAIPAAALPEFGCEMGLAAVIEEESEHGHRMVSFWALAHRREVPDFHDPASFNAVLPPSAAR